LCDNYFSEVAGPSTPNHCMLVAADPPVINNPYGMYRPSPTTRWTLPSVPDLLNKVHKSWAAYGSYIFGYFNALSTTGHLHGRDQFAKDVAAGKLANVSWVYGDGTPNYSEHPTQNVTSGCQWTVDQVKAVAASPLWSKTMIVITWDDWGGWADHVTPPVAETWSHTHAQHPADGHPAYDGQPFRYGSRVPCLVVGPYAKPGHISHQLNSHVSVPRLIEDVFMLPHLNSRDAASNGLSDCYDLTQPPNGPYA
jgi:phospholipase C